MESDLEKATTEAVGCSDVYNNPTTYQRLVNYIFGPEKKEVNPSSTTSTASAPDTVEHDLELEEELNNVPGSVTDINMGLSKQSRWRRLFFPQLTKHSLYVYGSVTALQNECARQEAAGVCIIHPFSPIRNYYIMFMVFITFINLIAIPMELAFLEGEHTEEFRMVIFNLCSDTLFLLDIAINFRMGVITEDSEVVLLDPKLIACHYLKSWFVLDLISAFPVDYVILIVKELEEDQSTTTYTASKLVRVVLFARIFSLIRLLRVSRLVRFFSEWEQVANSNMEAVRLFIRIICLFAMILLLCHWNGCIQYFIPSLQDFPEDCWVVRENLTHAPWIEKYSFGVFRALSHMIGVGYGSADPPTGEAELWVVMTSMVSGALMYTMMVANVAAMMTNVDAASKAYRSKFNHLEDYMSYRKLPKNLRSRISTYYQARYQGKWFDERAILNVLSESLKVEILGNLCTDLVKTVPMFQGRDINFINAVLLKLQCEVFQEGDIIIREKAAGDRMFFIEHGRVMVKTEQKFCTELADGDYFGEICLLTKCRRTASVQALTLCNLFSLSAEKFNEVLKDFPEIKEEMLRTASQRLWTLQDLKDQKQTPLSENGTDKIKETSTLGV
ncbi:potassium/sodium hyperpolarization-activated cyclic nucleotide-gated channel 1-like [Huso huso]|uniref:Potassium/sodium hyperpolarization-activated cyclic nucleotide-gated channel 1-like n=1 Tax=Huso huso TaxID=61971 RepID=A0ABR0ZQP8_HUSHU